MSLKPSQLSLNASAKPGVSLPSDFSDKLSLAFSIRQALAKKSGLQGDYALSACRAGNEKNIFVELRNEGGEKFFLYNPATHEIAPIAARSLPQEAAQYFQIVARLETSKEALKAENTRLKNEKISKAQEERDKDLVRQELIEEKKKTLSMEKAFLGLYSLPTQKEIEKAYKQRLEAKREALKEEIDDGKDALKNLQVERLIDAHTLKF